MEIGVRYDVDCSTEHPVSHRVLVLVKMLTDPGVPCVTLRDNTERPETVEVGANVLAGTEPEKIVGCARNMIERERTWENPFGDGMAGERIRRIMAMV